MLSIFYQASIRAKGEPAFSAFCDIFTKLRRKRRKLFLCYPQFLKSLFTIFGANLAIRRREHKHKRFCKALRLFFRPQRPVERDASTDALAHNPQLFDAPESVQAREVLTGALIAQPASRAVCVYFDRGSGAQVVQLARREGLPGSQTVPLLTAPAGVSVGGGERRSLRVVVPTPVAGLTVRALYVFEPIAEALSPPPMMVTAPFCWVAVAIARAIDKVPPAVASISNTPIGPFHTTVFAP